MYLYFFDFIIFFFRKEPYFIPIHIPKYIIRIKYTSRYGVSFFMECVMFIIAFFYLRYQLSDEGLFNLYFKQEKQM